MTSLCISQGVGQYVASERHIIAYDRLTKPPTKTVLHIQGSHSLANVMLQTDSLDRTLALASAGFVIIGGDLSQTPTQGTFGNDTARTRVGQLRTFIEASGSPFKGQDKVCLIGGSGGATACINYARANPTQVAAMYLMAPLVDIEDFYTNYTDASITKSEVNKAYNNGVDDGGTAYLAAMPTHNPARAGNQAALAGIPVRIAYSTNDPYISLASVSNYVDALNAIGSPTTSYSQGAVDHSAIGVDPNDVVNFFNEYVS